MHENPKNYRKRGNGGKKWKYQMVNVDRKNMRRKVKRNNCFEKTENSLKNKAFNWKAGMTENFLKDTLVHVWHRTILCKCQHVADIQAKTMSEWSGKESNLLVA